MLVFKNFYGTKISFLRLNTFCEVKTLQLSRMLYPIFPKIVIRLFKFLDIFYLSLILRKYLYFYFCIFESNLNIRKRENFVGESYAF